MGKLGVLLLILLLGGAILAPAMMMFEFEPMPGDFLIPWNNTHLNVPVLWSLCASGAFALLYAFLKK
jgi:hypothetical protein